MKKLENPTTFFFKQAENPPDLYRKQIDQFVNKLINKDICQLCKKSYHSTDRIPRTMVHCGHTFCTQCLLKFYMNRRVRCPMCLKLVKQIDNIQRIPINHTIFTHIVKKQAQQLSNHGKTHIIKDPTVYLFGQFERVQKQAHLQENPQRIDPDSGLPFCVFHNDRVQHFYCESHRASGCRVCIQIGHNRSQCSVIDLYNVPDPQRYLNPLQANIQGAQFSQPLAQFYRNGNNNRRLLGTLNVDDEQQLQIDDDSDDQQERKSI